MKKKSPKNNLATKTDIKKIVKSIAELKSESRSTKKSLWREILRVEERAEVTEDKLSKQMKEQHDQVMNTLSDFTGRVKDLENENTVGADQYREHDVKIKDHEARLTTL